MANKLWCVITGIGKTSVFGYTHDHEHVVFRKCADGLAGVQHGDVVEFEPSEFKGGDPAQWKRTIKWFGSFPVIIARNVEETAANNPATKKSRNYKGENPQPQPVTRPRPDAVVCKQEHETRADEAARVEVLQ